MNANGTFEKWRDRLYAGAAPLILGIYLFIHPSVVALGFFAAAVTGQLSRIVQRFFGNGR